MPGPSCPDDERFRQLLERRLPATELASLQQHIDACGDCMSLLLELVREDRPVPEQVDEYSLLRVLGRGAMGQVFVARDTRLDRLVAIKFLASEAPSDAARERFFVEARAIARLSHPNVVRIHRVGEAAQRPYLVSELISGKSLDALHLPMPMDRVLAIGIGLCRGLFAAHQAGVLHRDIKPANVMLADDGEVKILDFGLAKLQEAPWPNSSDDAKGPHHSTALTQTGAVLGTPRYMAPELWERQSATEQSDIYALGALLYELCAGRPPHEEKTLRALHRAVLRRPIRPLREVARGVDRTLSDLVERCLRRDPAERFASADALGKALEDLRGAQAQARSLPVAAPAVVDRQRRQRRMLDAGHRALCFVRRSELATVLELLRREALVLVAGDAGAGKSAFCKDAVLPAISDGALADGRVFSLIQMTPGPHPLSSLSEVLAPWSGVDARELAARLRSDGAALRKLAQGQAPGSGLILFIDQTEELLIRSDTDEAAALGELLGECTTALPGLRTLLAVRGEYLSRLAALPGLGDALTRAICLLRPLSAATAFAEVRRLKMDPNDSRMLRKLGAAYRQLGRYDAAAAVLERAVERSPEDARVRRLLAITHFKCGHLDAAITQARQVARLQPESARGLRLLGRLCLLARDFEPAQQALQKAVALQPTDRRAHRFLGEALLGCGRAAEAVVCFERAAQLGLGALSRPGFDV
jgi:tetratricopeptide (TPR) repeat protein